MSINEMLSLAVVTAKFHSLHELQEWTADEHQ
jgi:hypothetical protein